MTDLTDVDRDALTLAIEVTRRESPARRQQIDNFLATREWIYVATFCAGCAQSRSLQLPPWQPSPCFVGDMAAALNNTDEQSGYRAAALLRQRMESHLAATARVRNVTAQQVLCRTAPRTFRFARGSFEVHLPIAKTPRPRVSFGL
jgi:hypothetical protein